MEYNLEQQVLIKSCNKNGTILLQLGKEDGVIEKWYLVEDADGHEDHYSEADLEPLFLFF